jgi:hypothetical protein
VTSPNRPLAWTAALLALALFAPTHALPAPVAPPAISALAWLAGSWGGTQDGIASEEHWTTADGDALVGMHKDVRSGKMISFEFLRIAVDAEQRVCYVSMPGGGAATSFCAVEAGDKRVVFENRQHDFPQRILYWLDTAGKLHARIEGPPGTGESAMEWVWSPIPR